ncbi:hypothetical protein ACFYO1_24635 [Nocardia sp. NPDC006044]|uniref:hypothetical protein n=1 Tax=Nocardia sp. NPDC006044 TaxID=3364306 RepID=UPI0036C543C0
MTWDWLTDLRSTPALGAVAGALAALIVAFVTGWFTSRSSHKLPHERLHLLVQIQKGLPSGTDREGVIRTQIGRELAVLRRYRPPNSPAHSLVWVSNSVALVLTALAFTGRISWWGPIAAFAVSAGILGLIWLSNS